MVELNAAGALLAVQTSATGKSKEEDAETRSRLNVTINQNA